MPSILGTPSDIRVDIHTGPLARLEARWQDVLNPLHPGAPFRTFEWVASWWNARLRAGQSIVLVARRDAEVVGLLPLYAAPTLFGGRQLRLMGDGLVGSDYLGAIAQPEHLSGVSAACAARLAELPVDEVDLDGLLNDDPLVTALLENSRASSEARYRCPFVRTQGKDVESYLEGLPEGVGHQFRRRLRGLQRLPGFALEVLTTPDEVARGMQVLFELHRRRWALADGSDGIVGGRVEAFHLAVGRALARRGWARLFLLHVDGAPRAALYGWLHADRFAFYQAGHDPAWRNRSVGTVLLGLVIRTCFAEGLSEFDFLHGAEPYKLRWATGSRHTVRVRLRGHGLRPRLHTGTRRLLDQLRGPVRQFMPPPVRRTVRALRRARTLT